MYEKKGMPPWLGAIVAGAIVFALLSNFVGPAHVADEYVIIGAAVGLLVYLSGAVDVVNTRTGERSGW